MPSPKKARSLKSKENEALVIRVLEKIATVLLRLGFDAPSSERLLRCGFVLAAIRHAESTGTRPTQSQIALIAGVNRLDVRRILAEGLRPDQSREIERQSRIERIVEGWRQDSKFLDARGRPKPLTISGRKSEFAKLVRTYGRDVTVRTFRDTLIRTNVAHIKGNSIELAEHQLVQAATRLAGASDLSYLSAQLAPFDLHTGRRTFVGRTLTLPADNAKTLRFLQRKAAGKIETALSSLESVVLRPGDSRRGKKGHKHRLIISTTLSAESDIGDLV
jgi:hypothetical protein